MCYLKLLNPETMKTVESTKSKINKNDDGENGSNFWSNISLL